MDWRLFSYVELPDTGAQLRLGYELLGERFEVSVEEPVTRENIALALVRLADQLASDRERPAAGKGVDGVAA